MVPPRKAFASRYWIGVQSELVKERFKTFKRWVLIEKRAQARLTDFFKTTTTSASTMAESMHLVVDNPGDDQSTDNVEVQTTAYRPASPSVSQINGPDDSDFVDDCEIDVDDIDAIESQRGPIALSDMSVVDWNVALAGLFESDSDEEFLN
ncbi:hypothetical protein OIO90_005222 [Microbotryomycetes sp. JL221]|nr:hypothetical protein OIO90_005222 [Microbotryomycetes sp. JL221]